MKNYLALIVVLILLGGSVKAQSTTDQVSSSSTIENNRLNATIICLDAIEAPTKYNEFAKQFINNSTFPIRKTSSSREEYQKEINNWLISNSLLIDKILIERKKAHDILYGPRPF